MTKDTTSTERKKTLLKLMLAMAGRIMELKKGTMCSRESGEITLAGLHYVEAIAEAGTPTMVELAQAMELSKPSITVMIAKLIEAGLVDKSRSPEDGRVFHLSLTPKGKRIVEQHQAAFHAFADQITGKLDDSELDALVALLAKIV